MSIVAGLNNVFWAGPPGRLTNETLQAGEISLNSIVTAANTRVIYRVNPTGWQAYNPANATFAPFRLLEAGRTYVIDAISNYNLPGIITPASTSAVTARLTAPTLSVSSPGAGQLRLNWSAPEIGTVTGYQVEYWLNGTWTGTQTLGNVLQYTYTGLPARVYAGRVRSTQSGAAWSYAQAPVAVQPVTGASADLLDGRMPNLPALKRQDVLIAVANATVNQPWTQSDLIDTLGFLRLWASAEPLATGTQFNAPAATVASWGSSVDGLSQPAEASRPWLTTEGLDITMSPPGWMSYDGSFLANSNFTIFIQERREALNAGFILGGSNSSNGTNLQVGYVSPTSFVFSRLGSANLSYTVPNSLSSDFRLWALRFNGTQRSLWLNGSKVAEVNDSGALSSYNGSALGWAFEPSYIGKIRHYAISSAALTDSRIAQISLFLQQYTALYPATPPEVPTGSISLTLPLANTILAQDILGNASFIVQGNFTVEEGSLTAIEARFADRAWKTIASRPLGATFSAMLSEPAGSGSIQVRFKGADSVNSSVSGVSIVNANPTNIALQPGLGALTVTWDAPTGVTVSSYSVSLSEDAGTTWVDVDNLPTTPRSYTFNNLAPGDYIARVRTNLAFSASPWIVGSVPATVQGNPPAVINSNLWTGATSYWPLETGTWADRKGLHNLTPTGGVILGAQVLGSGVGSASFDGTGYLTVSDASAFRMTATHTWIFNVVNSGSNTSTARLGVIASKSNAASTAGSRSYTILLDSSNQGDRITVQLSNNGTSTTLSLSSARYPAKSELFVCVVYKPGVDGYTRIWVNNALDIEGGVSSLNQSTTIPLRLGANLTATTGGTINNPLIGRLDNVIFLNREITREEIEYLWNNGVVRELTQP